MALVRVFLGNVLAVYGADDVDVSDVKIAVSDLVTGLVEAGTPIEVEAKIAETKLLLTGNLAGPPPSAGGLLLGSRLELGETHWAIRLHTT